MKLLHILSESEADAFFYERIAERVSGRSFIRCDIRLRKGAGQAQVMASIRLLLNRFPRGVPRPDAAVLLTVDNDRCSGHPGASPYPKALSSAEQRRPSRWMKVREVMEARWGDFRGNWPVDVAVAIPVEMIESWVLLLLDPSRAALPIHARQADKSAAMYHHPEKPEPQLKDLLDEEVCRRKTTHQDLLMEASEAEFEPVLAVSPSFRLFVEELTNWR